MLSSTPSRQEAATEILRRKSARTNLQTFTEYTTPRWKAGKIHRIICDQLDRVIRGEVDRLMLLCPPQHGKSTAASKRFPAYVLGLKPETDVVSASATAQLAEEFGREVRNCIGSSEYAKLFPKTTLAEDSQAKGRWNTNQGGGYYAVGMGGALMGRGGELGIIDDPFATWDEAQSQLVRDKAWDWYTGTFYNRIRPGGPIILIQHRMHEDDLAGRLITEQANGGDRWEIVEVPALLDDPPWVERYDRPALERIKRASGPRKWAALYDQNPRPDVGTFFQRDWFRRYTAEQIPTGMHRYASSDHAPSGTESGDFTCFRVWGVDAIGDLWLLDGFRHQATLDVSMDLALTLIAKHKPLCWFPEDDNNWKAIAGFVTKAMRKRSVFCRIEPVSPHGADKQVKAQSFQAMASMRAVWLPLGPDGDDVLEQYVAFPGGKHDDEVDAAAVIGRAIDQAHAGIVTAKPKQDPKDGWDDDLDPNAPVGYGNASASRR